MAISIAYGIGCATILTLVMLPIFLSFSNWMKTTTDRLIKGRKTPKEIQERAVKELEEEAQNDAHEQQTAYVPTPENQ
jgi:hypothetical protein